MNINTLVTSSQLNLEAAYAIAGVDWSMQWFLPVLLPKKISAGNKEALSNKERWGFLGRGNPSTNVPTICKLKLQLFVKIKVKIKKIALQGRNLMLEIEFRKSSIRHSDSGSKELHYSCPFQAQINTLLCRGVRSQLYTFGFIPPNSSRSAVVRAGDAIMKSSRGISTHVPPRTYTQDPGW